MPEPLPVPPAPPAPPEPEPPPEQAEVHPALEQAERIAGSPLLQQADSLVRLLRYLARHAVENPGTPLREAQIAREVFARGDGFDPRNDSTVRVQCSRLRGRLAEYYRTQGAGDEVVLELPRGQYHLVLRRAGEEPVAVVPEAAAVEAAVAEQEPAAVAAPAVARQWLGRVACAAGGLAAGALMMFALFPPAVSREARGLPPALAGLWRPLLASSRAPVVYVPVAGGAGGAVVAGPHVQAAHEMTRLLARAGRPPRLQPVGAPVLGGEAAILVGIPPAAELQRVLGFAIRDLPAGDSRAGAAAIVNLDPAPGESVDFVAGGERYALLARLARSPGGGPLVLVAGATPEATQAAAMLLTREDFAALVPGGEGDSWAAVVRVGTPGAAPIALLRRLNP